MRIKLVLVALLVFLLALPLMAAPPKGKTQKADMALQIDNTTFIDANRIFMFVTNHGNFGRDLADYFGHDYGSWYPYGGDPSVLYTALESQWTPNYASGIWIGAIDSVTDSLMVAISEYSSEYTPGPMAGGTFQTDIPDFRVFKLYADSGKNNPNQDYLDYMNIAYPTQGAPVRIDTTWNEDTTVVVAVDTVPDDFGATQFLWSVYNDADVSQHTNMSTSQLGIEVKQSLFAYRGEDPIGDVVYVRYRVYNKGNRTLDSCYISLWCDPDLGSSGDDYVGCDTNTSLGFVYNANTVDNNYAPQAVPAMGFDFLQGPLLFTGDMADTARMWGQFWAGYQNLGMESFNKYINGTDPDDASQVYNYQRGLTRDGGDYTYDGQVLTYVLSGDPVAGSGDLDIAPADRRFMQSTGPITFRPGDSTEIYAAIVLAQSVDNLTSISLMKNNDVYAQFVFDEFFERLIPPAPPVVNASFDENVVSLAWTDTSEVDHGSFPFEGYTILQGLSRTGPWTQVRNFDILNGVKNILDEKFNPVNQAFETVLYKKGEDLGVKRSVQITQDVINGGNLRNLTTYYYKVDAYSYSPDGPSSFKTLTSSATIQITPEAGIPEQIKPDYIGETFAATHTAGVSDGVVMIEIVNPDSLTGHTYNVVFADTLGIVVDTTVPDPINEPNVFVLDSTNIAWHLIDVTTGDTLLAWQTNQAGDDDYKVTDGFVARVSGPFDPFNQFQVVANAGGVVDPPEPGAFWFQGFPVPTENDPDGYITAAQQVWTPGGQWGLHTGDNGGSADGGNRGSFDAFLERVVRNDNADRISIYDFEMRFNADTLTPGTNGSYAVGAFDAAPEPVYWVPFEIWRIGIGTPNDASDDVRMMPWMIDTDVSGTYNLANWGSSAGANGGDYEHSASGGSDDPYTDWIYWIMPSDDSPGETGYTSSVAMLDLVNMNAGTYDFNGDEVFARTVLVSWNGGVEPPFDQGLPEQGTVFRIVTNKPNASSDVFAFSTTPAQALASTPEELLDKIKAVPNPFYLTSGYNNSPGNYTLKLHHLPETCTISFYNLSGELVRTVEKNDGTTGIAEWDLLTEQGLPVASGIYIYVVEAPGIGQKVGKVAIFVEQEVLKIY